MPAAAFANLLDGPPSSAGPSAPARGLTLLSVEYDVPLFAAPEQAE